MGNLTVEINEGAEALEALRREWQELFRGALATGAAPFLSWEWMSAWQRWLGGERAPYLLCAREDGKLVGLLPLSVEELRRAARARRLTMLGAGFGGADYLDALALPEHRQAVTAALFAHLAERGEFDLLELEGLPADSPSLPLLSERFANLRVEPQFVCPQIDLSGGWEAVLKQSRRAENFQRRLRQMRKYPDFAYRAVTQPAEAVAAFERFLKLHEPRWVEQGGSELTGHEALCAFQRDLVTRLAAAGWLRFDELWVEGECRASIYGLDDGRRYCFYNSGYDETWRQASPGLVLLGLSIDDAARRGVIRYDFLRGEEKYKLDWANETRATVVARAAQRTLPALLVVARERVQTAARAAAQTLLPERAGALLRRWHRARKRANALVEAA